MTCIAGGVLPSGAPHFYWSGLASLWIFSAAVSAMTQPGDKSSVAYQWLYRFTHLLAANLDRAGLFEARVPEIADDANAGKTAITNTLNT
jgi:hypothetical protein